MSALVPVPDKKLTGFQRTGFLCSGCQKNISVETDYTTTDSAAIKLHKCYRGGKSEQKKTGKL